MAQEAGDISIGLKNRVETWATRRCFCCDDVDPFGIVDF